MEDRPPRPLTAWLARAPRGVFVVYAIAAAFTTYFAMYAFRKPFLAAIYPEGGLGGLELKSTLAISQIAGYTLAKYLGTRFVSEVPPARRAWTLVGLIVTAEVALLLFAVLPGHLKVGAIFLNGLPLGMVWGMVVLYLEGRRTSEFLFAGLASSYILASGVVKDVGRGLLERVDLWWMPVTTGLLFLPVFLLAVWLLDQLPPPDDEDRAQRIQRAPMDAAERRLFVRTFAAGLGVQLAIYFFVTAFRDFRDNYGIEIFTQLGYAGEPAIFSTSELLVAFTAIAALVLLNLVPGESRYALLGNYGMMAAGLALMAGGTGLFDLGAISGLAWMIAVGMGGYLVYVANGTVFYDRLIASTGFAGTAVFAIYLTDAVGYTGSIGLPIFKDLVTPDLSRLDFLRRFAYGLSVLGAVGMVFNAIYFVRRGRVGSAP